MTSASREIADAGYQLQDMPPPAGAERARLLTRLDKARWAIGRVGEETSDSSGMRDAVEQYRAVLATVTALIARQPAVR